MTCKKCKQEIEADSVYCRFCGSAQSRDKKKAMYQRPDGLFEKIIMIDGKRVTFRGKTEKDIYHKMAEYKGNIEKGKLFSEIADNWKELTWERVAVNTLKGYKAGHDAAVNHFKARHIKEIIAKDVQAYIGIFIAKGFAFKTVKNYLLVLSLIFQHGIVLGELENNPCSHIKIPQTLKKTNRQAPNAQDIEKILNTDSTMKLFAMFLLYTGCRLGESLAITREDIDITNKVLNISKSVYYDGATPKIKSTKTVSGCRQVPIPDVIVKMLPAIGNDEYLFGNRQEITKKHVFDKKWKLYQNELGIKITPHQLRHGYATLLYEAGVDMKDAQYLLGHANISTTMDVYTHLSQEKKLKVFDKFNVFIKNTHNIEKTAL